MRGIDCLNYRQRQSPCNQNNKLITREEFLKNKENFTFSTLYNNNLVLKCFTVVRKNLCVVESATFFPSHFVSASTMEEFFKSVSSYVDKYFNDISENWHSKLVKEFRDCFSSVKKGWFNLNERNWSIYKISKMKLLIERVRFMMQVWVV